MFDAVVDVKLVGMSISTGGSPQLTRKQTAGINERGSNVLIRLAKARLL